MSSPSTPTRYPWLLGLAIALPLALLIALSLLTHRAKEDLNLSRAAVKRLAEAQSQTALLLTEMVNNEAGQRGYIVSQIPSFLEPYDRSLKTIPVLRSHLAAQLADAEARQLFAFLEISIDTRLAFSAQTTELQRNGQHDVSVKLIQTGRGKELMDQVRTDAAALDHRLTKLIADREDQYTSVVRWNERISWSLVGADVLIVGALIAVLLRLRRAEQILTVCAWSKTVRYEGEWVSYDEYLTRKFGISITHGISPEEARKMREMIEAHPPSGVRAVAPPRR